MGCKGWDGGTGAGRMMRDGGGGRREGGSSTAPPMQPWLDAPVMPTHTQSIDPRLTRELLSHAYYRPVSYTLEDCLHTHTHACRSAHACRHTHTQECTHMNLRTHAHTNRQTHTHAHIEGTHKHTRIHAHTSTDRDLQKHTFIVFG